MKLKVINSNSKGNCYILKDNTGEILLIECGVVIDKIKQAVDYDMHSIVGCILSHGHSDHCKAAKDLVKYGVRIYTSEGTKNTLKIPDKNAIVPVLAMKKYKVGNYTIMPFKVEHDCSEPYGFLIQHAEMGLCLFMTDTYYCEYVFQNLNNIIIEANYCEDIIDKKLALSKTTGFVRDRVLQSHMSIQTCIKTLQSYDLKRVNNIVIIHLSNGNSSEIEFKQKVRNATGCNVHIADKGMEINFDKTPF